MSRMRPETFVATVESSASILPLSTMMFRGTGGCRIKNHQIKKPPAMIIRRTVSAMMTFARFFDGIVGNRWKWSLLHGYRHVVGRQRVAGSALQLSDSFVQVSLGAQLVSLRCRQSRLTFQHQEDSRLA